MQFDHIGIPVESPPPEAEEFWVADSQTWVTNPRTHPQRIEYLRFKNKPQVDPRSPEWKLWNMPHIAYQVEDLESAIEGEEVVLGPFDPGDFARVVFIHKNGVILEYMQYRDTSNWFGQPTPLVSP